MPQILRCCLDLGQQQGVRAQEALELENAASGRWVEQVVIEESGVDRLIEEEFVALGIAVDVDDRDTLLIEGAGSTIDVVDLDQRLSGHITVDREAIGGGTRLSEKRVDGKGRVARRDELQVASTHSVRDLETISDLIVLKSDEALILEALEIDEGA